MPAPLRAQNLHCLSGGSHWRDVKSWSVTPAVSRPARLCARRRRGNRFAVL